MKTYIMPTMQVCEAEVESMVALSIMSGNANPNETVLSKDNNWGGIWDKEE